MLKGCYHPCFEAIDYDEPAWDILENYDTTDEQGGRSMCCFFLKNEICFNTGKE